MLPKSCDRARLLHGITRIGRSRREWGWQVCSFWECWHEHGEHSRLILPPSAVLIRQTTHVTSRIFNRSSSNALTSPTLSIYNDKSCCWESVLAIPPIMNCPYTQAMPKPAGASALGTSAASQAFKRQRTAPSVRCQDSKVRPWHLGCFRLALHNLALSKLYIILPWWLQGADMMDDECLSHATRSDGVQGQCNPLIPDHACWVSQVPLSQKASLQ